MRIKGKVSHIFHSMESGFKIIALEISKNSAIPEKYRNPDFPFSVSVVGNLKLAQEEYVVEVTGEWERRENGRYWPWQFKVDSYTVCDFETPRILMEVISDLNSSAFQERSVWSKPTALTLFISLRTSINCFIPGATVPAK